MIHGLHNEFENDFHNRTKTSPSSSSSTSSPTHTMIDHSAYVSKASSTVSDIDYASGESLSAAEGLSAPVMILKTEVTDASTDASDCLVDGRSRSDGITVINRKSISPS